MQLTKQETLPKQFNCNRRFACLLEQPLTLKKYRIYAEVHTGNAGRNTYILTPISRFDNTVHAHAYISCVNVILKSARRAILTYLQLHKCVCLCPKITISVIYSRCRR